MRSVMYVFCAKNTTGQLYFVNKLCMDFISIIFVSLYPCLYIQREKTGGSANRGRLLAILYSSR